LGLRLKKGLKTKRGSKSYKGSLDWVARKKKTIPGHMGTVSGGKNEQGTDRSRGKTGGRVHVDLAGNTRGLVASKMSIAGVREGKDITENVGRERKQQGKKKKTQKNWRRPRDRHWGAAGTH